MKIKNTRDQVTKVVLSLCLGLIGTGFLCWPALKRSSAGKAFAVTGGAAVTRPAASLTLEPSLRQVSFRPFFGPVSGAADATARAVLAANSVARRDYSIEPFTGLKPAASFDGQVWSWRNRVAWGHGDFEAEVRIAPDGTTESVEVEFLTQLVVNAQPLDAPNSALVVPGRMSVAPGR
jgi:hypothetical protein